MWLLFFFPFLVWGVPNPAGRPSKAPFISGDAFRAYADFCYDEVDRSLDPAAVMRGSTIFVKTDYLDRFFQDIHPKIGVPYILISHNSDDPTPGVFARYLDDEKIVAWFGQNYDGTSHPKMHPIPMGIANFCWEHGNADLIPVVLQENRGKVHLAHMQFNVQTYVEERGWVQKYFSKASYCYKPPKNPFRRYLADLAASKFEIAPRGHAWDTHRIWESVYVGTIPVVKTSPLDGLYSGLPILIIRDWKEVSERFLEKKYREMEWNLEKMSMDYWVRLIDSFKGN